MTKKHICILILALIFIIAVRDLYKNGFGFFEVFWEQPDFQGASFHTSLAKTIEAEQELTINRDNKKKLNIFSPAGSIEVQGVEGDQIKIHAKISAYTESDKLTSESLEKIQLIKNRGFKTIQIDVTNFKDLPDEVKGIRVDYIVEVPKDMMLDLESRDLLKVNNITNSLQVNTFGETELSEITGDLKLSLGQYSGTTSRIEEITGKIEASVYGATVRFSKVKGDISVYGSSSKLLYDSIDGNLEGDINLSSWSAEDIRGQVALRGTYSHIGANNVQGSISVKGKFGDVKLYNLRNDVDLDLRYTDTLIKSELNHMITAEAYMGNLSIDAKVIEKVKKNKTTWEAKGQIGQGEYTLKVKNRYSNIIIQPVL